MCACLRVAVLLSAMTSAASALAADAYYRVPVRDLELTEGALPSDARRPTWQMWDSARAMRPRAVLDGEGEAYLDRIDRVDRWARLSRGDVDEGNLVVRAPEGADVAGRLLRRKPDWSGMAVARFKIPASAATPEAREAFYRAKMANYEDLLSRGIPGGAWFRHQTRQARIALHGHARDDSSRNVGPARARTSQLTETYELFTGGRAMSENLQLDRVLPAGRAVGSAVDVDSIEGITVEEIDWEPLIKDLEPELDPLAAMIPSDQHVVFFPTFDAARIVAKLMDQQGTFVMRLADPRSEDGRTLQRYQRQLCLSLDDAAPLLGPDLARSVALTGSDPYVFSGTDVAVLVESPNPALLEESLLAGIHSTGGKGEQAKRVEGEIDGLKYHGVRSDDRSVSSYVARLDGAVVVTNSPHQLGRLASVRKGESESIAALPEYTFFRNRYRRGDPEETALLYLSDATIRRWCGPRWRIGASRRTRDAAVMAEMQARYLDDLVRNSARPRPIHTDLPMAYDKQLGLEPTGVRSATSGTLAFMTPIAELPISRVTAAEADAYRRWRDGYQRNWSVNFDPIALRLTAARDSLSADLTVMPLILRTQYRQFVSLTRGAEFAQNAGDLHDALGHFIIGINKESSTFRIGRNFASMMMHGLGVDPFAWLGESVAVYVDDDPFWHDLAKVEPHEREEFFLSEGHRLPIAVRAEVSSGLKLTIFLAAVRGMIEQSAPGMTEWETLTYKDEPYVRVSPSERARRDDDVPEKLAVYYAPSGDSLVVTLSESVLQRALDRRIDRREPETEGKPVAAVGKPWLGSNVGLQVDRKVLETITHFGRAEYQAMMQARAWGNLPILNEWKRLYPDQDPVELHERIWHTRLVCPGRGEYAWNAEWQTMESTVYGHPGEPKRGPAAPPTLSSFTSGNFGLTFEEQGLRARVSLERNTAAADNSESSQPTLE